MTTVEQEYQATLEGFTSEPLLPKELAEGRVVSLQNELNSLDPSAEDFATRQQTLTREIQEMQDALDSGAVTENAEEIQAYFTYKTGLREFILAKQA